jgi:hypothetical protein
MWMREGAWKQTAAVLAQNYNANRGKTDPARSADFFNPALRHREKPDVADVEPKQGIRIIASAIGLKPSPAPGGLKPKE